MVRERCVQRLLSEYERHGELIVAVDFDDTIFDYHNIDTKHDMVIELLKEGVALNFHYIIYTASSPDRYSAMMNYFQTHVGKYAPVNKNRSDLKFGKWGKIYYNIFLDDRAGLYEAYEILKETVKRIKEKNDKAT